MGKTLSKVQPCFKCLHKTATEYEFHQKVKDVAALVTEKETSDFKEAFDDVADADGEVDAYQLKEALNKAFQQGIYDFSLKPGMPPFIFNPHLLSKIRGVSINPTDTQL